MPISKILDFFDLFCISNTKIGIALSGGSDSIFLLHSLHSLQKKLKLNLSIIHVNYHLRGDDSNSDADFVENIATQLHIPFYKLDSPIDPQSSSIEAKARDIRYEFFNKVRCEQNIHYIALGHTSEDQVETVLFRLIRGSSLYGLSGMEEVREDGIIRPMLQCTKDECNNWLNENSHDWREDLSNQEKIFTRNLIRHEMIPLISKINSGASSHILTFSQQCQSSYDELFQYGKKSLEDLSVWESPDMFHLHKWDNFSESLKIAIAELLRKRDCTLSDHHLTTIADAGKRRGKETLLPNGWRIYSSYKRIIFYKATTSPFSGNRNLCTIDKSITENGLYQLPFQANTNEAKTKTIRDLNNNDAHTLVKRLKKMGVPSKERYQFPISYANGEYQLLSFC